MRVYLVSAFVEVTWGGAPTNLLVSFARIRAADGIPDYVRAEYGPGRPKNILLDSGAFSVQTGRAQISLDSYIRWLQEHGHNLDIYANLDVIGDPAATWENQMKIEAAGLHPLPTFHFGSPVSYLERMLDRYDYIGLGGMARLGATLAGTTTEKHVETCFAMNHRLRGGEVRFHAWGIASFPILLKFPFFSYDTSAHRLFAAVGEVPFWNAPLFRFETYHYRDPKLVEVFGPKALEFIDRSDREQVGYYGRWRQSVITYEAVADTVADFWRAKGVEYDQSDLHIVRPQGQPREG